tara:strand:+ start:517 stop:1167 length:651 start_codon:yes stop_codon:yes gene_type:complete
MSKLTIFDLDNTLLAGDSDRAWGQYLVETKTLESDYLDKSERFYNNYYDGSLDIDSFLQFCLQPLINNKMEDLLQIREDFINKKIKPMLLDKGRDAVEKRKALGPVIIATATNSFVTRPIADLYNIDQLIATEFEIKDNKFTGQVLGIPCFREGKVNKVQEWASKKGYSLSDATFYSDSFNDLPLLLKVSNAIVVDGDKKLIEEAQKYGWESISFR